MILNPLSNFRIQTITSQFVRPLLTFPAFAGPKNTGKSIFQGLDNLKPRAGTSSELPPQIKEKLLAILRQMPWFPAYTETPGVAFARGPGPEEDTF